MEDNLKIILPIAGLGTRLRPLTYTMPKPLVPLAGKTVLDFVLEKFSSLPPKKNIEYGFILGAMGEQVIDFMTRVYPEKKVTYFTQKEMRGQSDAIYSARNFLSGPILISFGDTITYPDFLGINEQGQDGIIWVKSVPDVSQQGIAAVDQDGFINQLYEKPEKPISNLVLVGVYFFKDGKALISAIEEQIQHGKSIRNEYYLADAINILIERGMKFYARTVDTWLDAGTFPSLLDTNAYLLEHGYANSESAVNTYPGNKIIPPVFIDRSAQIQDSIIGPFSVIEAGCKLIHVKVKNSIIRRNTILMDRNIENSIF